jgi:tight adherence protein B
VHEVDPHQLFIPLLAMLAVGGAFYAVAYPLLSGEAKADKRRAALQTRSPSQVANRAGDAAKRKKAVAESLKELDARTRSKKLTFDARVAQAGVAWTRTGYYGVSFGLAVVASFLVWLSGFGLFIVLCVAMIAGLGVPRWVLNHLRKRRLKRFLAELPAAVDIIVRGIRAGIPLGDCLRNIANEAAEPVKTEFRGIVEAQAMGLTIAEAVERLIDRVPTPEANFFSIVINIQQKAGGNLAEALTNLSGVLRDRKKMRGKIKAMSSEAKASAGIIGALPPIVAILVYLSSPDYMKLLFITPQGHVVLGVCAFWMACGIFIMKKMINFDM